MAYDIEYKFGFVLPITVTVPALRPDEETVTLCLGELEDCEAVACINVEEDDSWYIDEFRLENLPGTTTSGKKPRARSVLARTATSIGGSSPPFKTRGTQAAIRTKSTASSLRCSRTVALRSSNRIGPSITSRCCDHAYKPELRVGK